MYLGSTKAYFLMILNDFPLKLKCTLMVLIGIMTLISELNTFLESNISDDVRPDL